MNPTILRRTQKVLLVLALVIGMMGVVLVGGCIRNDRQIEANMATVMADVVYADRLHAAVNFQTPDGLIQNPRLLYPTDLTQGQRISVEYDTTNTDLARPAGRNASLAIVPALSVVAVGWLLIGLIMLSLAEINRWLVARRAAGDVVESSQV